MADILGFMRKALPWFTAAATGNVPALLTMVAQSVGSATGKTVKADTDSIAAAVAGATPEQLAAMKLAEQDFQLKMQQLGFQNIEDLEKIAAEDRASARNREIQVKDWTPRILAGAVIVLAFCGEGWILTHGYPVNVAGELVGRVLGTLDSALMLVLAYYFGSSAGSDRKTEIIANAGDGKQ